MFIFSTNPLTCPTPTVAPTSTPMFSSPPPRSPDDEDEELKQSLGGVSPSGTRGRVYAPRQNSPAPLSLQTSSSLPAPPPRSPLATRLSLLQGDDGSAYGSGSDDDSEESSVAASDTSSRSSESLSEQDDGGDSLGQPEAAPSALPALDLSERTRLVVPKLEDMRLFLVSRAMLDEPADTIPGVVQEFAGRWNTGARGVMSIARFAMHASGSGHLDYLLAMEADQKREHTLDDFALLQSSQALEHHRDRFRHYAADALRSVALRDIGVPTRVFARLYNEGPSLSNPVASLPCRVVGFETVNDGQVLVLMVPVLCDATTNLPILATSAITDDTGEVVVVPDKTELATPKLSSPESMLPALFLDALSDGDPWDTLLPFPPGRNTVSDQNQAVFRQEVHCIVWLYGTHSQFASGVHTLRNETRRAAHAASLQHELAKVVHASITNQAFETMLPVATRTAPGYLTQGGKARQEILTTSRWLLSAHAVHVGLVPLTPANDAKLQTYLDGSERLLMGVDVLDPASERVMTATGPIRDGFLTDTNHRPAGVVFM